MAYHCHSWVRENENVISVDDQVMVFDDESGVWIEDEGRVVEILQRLLGGNYGNNVKSEFLKGYVHARQEYRVEREDLGIDGPRVVLENGLLDLTEGKIVRDPEPEDFGIVQLPVRWEGPDALADKWMDYITESVEVESRDTIQEFTGYCLHTNGYPFKKALMLLGDGDNGKGVFENVLTALLGHDNVSNDDLSDLTENQFGLQRLRNKAANINSDIRGNELRHTSTFKKLTGRDRVRAEPKYQTAFEIENPAKLIFAANSIPTVKDAERAFYRRWLFVQFPNRFTFDEDDQYLDAIRNLDEHIIEEELSGVLAWAVEGYQRLQGQDGFTGEQSAEDIRSQWSEYQDTTATFVRNYVTVGNPRVDDELDHRMRVDEMYEYYERYIRATPTAPKSKQKLHNYITADHAFSDAETVACRKAVNDGEDKENVRVWDGVYIPLDLREELRERSAEAM